MVRLGWTKIQEVHGNVHANLSLVLFSVLARIWKVGIKMCYRLRSSDMFVSTECQDTHLSEILVHNIIKTYLKKPPSWSLLILHLKPQGINRTLQSGKIECLSCPVRFACYVDLFDLLTERNFSDSQYHFLFTSDGQQCATMLVENATSLGFPGEADLFVTQAVLQYV